MKKRIVAAALCVLMLSSLFACKKAEELHVLSTADPQSEAETTTEAAIVTTEPTTSVQTVTQVLTTLETMTRTVAHSETSTKATTQAETEPTTVTTTRREYDENMPDDYYQTVNKVFKDDLKYGVIRRRNIKYYIETLTDGSMQIVKEDISEYYNRLYYRANLEDLLPAAKENMDIYSDMIDTVLSTVNGYRAVKGIAPLELSRELTEIACARAEEIAWSGEHSHTRPNGKRFSSILKEAGITNGVAGENIGWGYETAVSVCKAWKDSESHYENIMNPDFVKIGIGVAADPDPDGKLCWTQIFLSE